MTQDFRSARFWAQELIQDALPSGGVAVDATMGNGHDTLWLCRLAGDEGRVYAFDVQQSALDSTARRLEEAGVRAKLILDGHQNMLRHVREPVDCVLFNLGWLPGADHGVTTRRETTLLAVSAATELLKAGGLLTICVYPGHEEGAREQAALLQGAAQLDAARFDVIHKRYLNQRNDPPQLIAVRKRT